MDRRDYHAKCKKLDDEYGDKLQTIYDEYIAIKKPIEDAFEAALADRDAKIKSINNVFGPIKHEYYANIRPIDKKYDDSLRILNDEYRAKLKLIKDEHFANQEGN